MEGALDLGSLRLSSGETLPSARVAYQTHGSPDAPGGAILYPTQFAAHHRDVAWIIGPGHALDPERYFIVVADQIGNGLSSAPSNTPPPFDRQRFPDISIRDDVEAQVRLLEHLGVGDIALVYGYSMGAMQAYQWAASYPERVARLAAVCGTARTTPRNAVFLDELRAALTGDPAWNGGEYQVRPRDGLRAFGRVYAEWGCSPEFYAREEFRALGFDSAEAFAAGFWGKRYAIRDANNLLCMIGKWLRNDLGGTPGCDGRLDVALGRIRARTTIVASETDLYFAPDDMRAESEMVAGARFRVIPTVWGHLAGAGIHPPDAAFIEAEVRELLSR